MRGPISVLVFESVTGGGLAGRDLPASWAVEGAAIRRAISRDFAALPGVRVVATLDARLVGDGPPEPDVRIVPDRDGRAWESIAAEVDYTVPIAPEAGGLLADLARSIARLGGRSIGSGPDAIELTADKGRLAGHFDALGIPTPPTRVVDLPGGWPADREGPMVVKPVDGAGSVDTFLVLDSTRPPPGLAAMRAVVQPYRPGVPSSASFLVDRDGRAWLVAVGRQRIEVDGEGRVHYRGGTIGGPAGTDLTSVEQAVTSVPGLRGFVGVDFLDDPRDGVSVLEINPRPTTSYVGLARLLPPGTIAGAWLEGVDRGLAETDWPDRLRVPTDASPVTFGPDGSILPDG